MKGGDLEQDVRREGGPVDQIRREQTLEVYVTLYRNRSSTIKIMTVVEPLIRIRRLSIPPSQNHIRLLEKG